MDTNTQSQAPVDDRKLWTVCQTFCGTSATNWMCSKCFKESGGTIETSQASKNSNFQTKSNHNIAEAKMDTNSDNNILEEEKEPEKPVQIKKNRCWKCNKKIGLLGFECKCKYLFCAKHRHASEHDCDYDYKKEAIENLKKNNPLFIESKVSEIN